MTRVQHLFIVRIWQEPDSVGAAVQWRGSLEHVPTVDRFYFAKLADLFDLITLRLSNEGDTTNGKEHEDEP